MKIAVGYDDLGQVALYIFLCVPPLSGKLDRCFHRFGSRVHGTDHIESGKEAKSFEKQGKFGRVDGTARKRAYPKLGAGRVYQKWGEMPVGDGGVGADAVYIGAPIRAEDRCPFRACYCYGERVVVVGAVSICEVLGLFLGKTGGKVLDTFRADLLPVISLIHWNILSLEGQRQAFGRSAGL